MSCADECCQSICNSCVGSCDDCCQSCCDDCCNNCGDSCCANLCGDATCDTLCGNCCKNTVGSASGISILKINTLTSFTIMMLSFISGIIGIFEQVPISITFLSIGLILTAFAILGLMIFPRISRSE